MPAQLPSRVCAGIRYLFFVTFPAGNLLRQSALAHEADVEFHGFFKGFQTDPLVVSVNGTTLFLGQIHGGEPVDLVGNATPVTGIGTLHHQVGGHDTAGPGLGYSGSYLVPAFAAGLGDGAGLKAFQHFDLHRFVINRLFQILVFS